VPEIFFPTTRTPAVKLEVCLSFGRVLSQLKPGLTLFAGTSRSSSLALPFCAPFLVCGESVVIVDGANCFNLYRLTEWAKRKQLSAPALLNRLRIARAFTCFQLATILHHIGGEMARHHASRLVITGLPDCLYDEELGQQEARNAFARCRDSLAGLAAQYTVLAFTDLPAHPVAERIRFFESLVALARSVFEVGNTQQVTFASIKSPGLITSVKEEFKDGKDSAHR